jgi:hypothetical protein
MLADLFRAQGASAPQRQSAAATPSMQTCSVRTHRYDGAVAITMFFIFCVLLVCNVFAFAAVAAK